MREVIKLVADSIMELFTIKLRLKVQLKFSGDKDEVFMKVNASEENYYIQADLKDYPLQLKRNDYDYKNGFSKYMPYAPYDMIDEGEEDESS
mmetsp:Transcript_27171/g.5015  ORF Transcript_27171/g.5015 Transcript_27171/m.5015 type:complete len:92 (+) Transcript_27171:307-582(+)|eukprot:CAMPEP_0168316226 /NCGR_PEP_ID=MMETSP0210-20121227/14953_1 /TAXON_ID=40633 /ORGANISM="Condylostoma magnum, Strain COL2" /LENGTH=91 /DNA_ID=CAMNT_0008296019 /DNA_START=309 /DNA_END=584 /DNA_ORIENTATION=-